MSFLLEFFAYAMIAVFLENILLSRALGTAQLMHSLRHGRDLLPFGLLITTMSTLTCLFTFPVNHWIVDLNLHAAWRPLAFVLVMSLLYLAIWFALRFAKPAFFASISRMLAVATFNGAVLGAAFLTADQNFNLARTLGFGLGSGLGFLVATLLVREGRRRLSLSNLPRSFRGFPALMLYLGMLALALYGLVGHQLPF